MDQLPPPHEEPLEKPQPFWGPNAWPFLWQSLLATAIGTFVVWIGVADWVDWVWCLFTDFACRR